MTRTRLQWAQWMAEKGIVVFIVEENTKRPLGGNSWYLRQSTDPQQIEEWFDHSPNCNYGVHLGSEYVVIDLDLKAGVNGIEEFEAICRENGVENFLFEFETLMVRTPGGGYHLYFKVPSACANKNTFPDGIDVRGAIGYVVGAGSKDSRGEWEIIDPAMPIMDCPEFLLTYLKEPGKKDPQAHVPLVELDLEENMKQAQLWLSEAKSATEGSNGDDFTYDICCMLRDFGLSEAGALEALNESGWNQRCDPPWQNDELEKKIENSYEYGQNRPGCAAESLQLSRIIAVGQSGYGLTDEKVAEMFHPPSTLELVVDNTRPPSDDDIPEDVADEEGGLAEFESDEQLWYGIRDFAAIENVREYIIKGWLIAHGMTGLLARRGTGKSTIALDLGCHLACDDDWWGIPTMKDWCVIYICGEDDEGMILNVRAWQKHHGKLPPNDRFLFAKGIISMTNEKALANRLKEMIQWADGRRCLVVLDTWQRATAGSKSNADDEMENMVKRAEFVAKRLNGPMLACFHPPKDGRMTIRGSAVQEDTSSGLWTLEQEADGIKLTIDRAKGSGKGNWRKFRFKTIKLDGVDFYKEKLEGIVPLKISGREDVGTSDYIEQEMNNRKAWATAIMGCHHISLTHTDAEEIKMNRAQVAERIAWMWENQETNDTARDFVALYMADLEEAGQTDYISSVGKAAAVLRQLDNYFFKADRNSVICTGGEVVHLAPTPGSKSKAEHFDIAYPSTALPTDLES